MFYVLLVIMGWISKAEQAEKTVSLSRHVRAPDYA